MKKILYPLFTILSCIVFPTNLIAQTWTTNSSDIMSDDYTNAIGIGIPSYIWPIYLEDKLSVYGDISFYPWNGYGDDGGVPHYIKGRSTYGEFGICGNTSWGDGASITFPGVYYSGSMFLNSYENGGWINFSNYSPSGNGMRNLMQLDPYGNAYLGDIDGTGSGGNISLLGDISLGNFFMPTGVPRNIMGNNEKGINIFSGTGNTDGSGIRLVGATASSNPGSIQLLTKDITPGAPALDLSTYNSSTSSSLSLLRVNKDGNTVIGTGVTPAAKLTVLNSMALSDIYGGSGWDIRSISGTTNYKQFCIYANTSAYDGPMIGMWGKENNNGRAGYLELYTYNGNFTLYKRDDYTWTRQIDVDVDGNMAIGTHSPTAERLSVEGDIRLYNGMDYVPRNIVGYSAMGSVNMYAGTGNVDGAGIRLFGPNALGHNGEVQLIASDLAGGTPTALELVTYNGTDFTSLFRVNKDGKAIIGNDIMSNTPGDYNLYVSKGILAEKLKVAFVTDNINWSDYVFNPDYKLRSLDEVESFVKENRHLPEIPSAQEVAKDGIDVAAMDAKLLQKIEELTLYIIQQQKNIDQQQKEIDALKKKIK